MILWIYNLLLLLFSFVLFHFTLFCFALVCFISFKKRDSRHTLGFFCVKVTCSKFLLQPYRPQSCRVDGIFTLELTWVLTPLATTPSDKSINQGPVCAHMHAQAQKILIFMSWTGECKKQKHT